VGKIRKVGATGCGNVRNVQSRKQDAEGFSEHPVQIQHTGRRDDGL